MSDERELQTGSGTDLSTASTPNNEEVSKFRAFAVDIATRGQARTGLETPYIPDDMYAEWVPNTKTHIKDYKEMGFDFPTKDILTNSVHNDGTGRAIHGDVVLMVIPKWKKAILLAEQRRQIDSVHKIGIDHDEQILRAGISAENAKYREVKSEFYNSSTTSTEIQRK